MNQDDGRITQQYNIQDDSSRPNMQEEEIIMDNANFSAAAARNRRRRKRSGINGFILTVLIAVIIGVLLRLFVFSFMDVVGPSMQPTLHTGNKVLVEKLSYLLGAPSRNDVVVCHYNDGEDYYIKRVIGLPGETLEIRDNILYINGQEVPQPYLDTAIFPLKNFGPIKIEEGHIFVVGDNRNQSMDSTSPTVGQLPLSNIKGCARLKVWPLNELGAL
ncbi:signal peptidase I [Clostridia bacterium OttesenSCG-928-F22]|nr:signal peptidase I [Clostridia bacterium OttesenSCG-928-F22]